MSRGAGRRTGHARRIAAWLGLSAVALVAIALAPVPAGGAATLTHDRTIGGPGPAFIYPWGAETLKNGDVLISDYWNYSIKRFTSGGDFVTELIKGTKGTDRGEHLAPYEIAATPNGNAFFFGDVDSQRTVDKYRANGTFLFDFGGPQRYSYPAYPAVTSDGRVVVADSRSHEISVNDAQGRELFRFGSRGDGRGEFQTPRGIDICRGCAPKNNDWLYVADSGNHRGQIWLLKKNGTKKRTADFVKNFGGSKLGAGRGGGNLRGVAVDQKRGFVYVVDAFTGFTNKFNLKGKYLDRFGGKGTGQGRFPTGGRSVTVDGKGRVWVADLAQFRVHVFSRKGAYRFQVPRTPQPPPLGGFNTPSDVAVDERGFIWVIDTMNQRFQKFDGDTGEPLGQWGIRGGPQAYGFNYPRGIAVDDSGPNANCPTYSCVIVADSDTGSIVKFDADGNFLWSYGAGTAAEGQHKSWSIGVADGGRIFVPELGQHRVLVLSAAGEPLDTFGGSQLMDPRGISVDPSDGSIWVADSVLKTVQHFTSDGDPIAADDIDLTVGPPSPTIQQPLDVQVSGTHVYVSDPKGHRVLVWEKDGTFVGVGASAPMPSGSVLGPMGMDIANGHLYVAESTRNRIHDFTITG
jgi:DNA-binding beta-propeller fold protein YncE